MKKVLRKSVLLILAASLLSGCNEKSKNDEISFDQPLTLHVVENEKKSLNYKYSDRYFLNDSNQFNRDLAYFSFAIATFKDNKEVLKLYQTIGFQSIDYENFIVNPEIEDHIGFSIANKQINDFYVISVALNGQFYKNEFAFNFKVGKDGNHLGFDNSSNVVKNEIYQYIVNRGLEGKRIKFHFSGYSRGGAVANLLGTKITDDIENNTVNFVSTANDIYDYTFEAPYCYHGDKFYNNIHNIVNRYDLVTCIIPENYGLKRAGIDVYIDSTNYLELINSFDDSFEMKPFVTKKMSVSFGIQYSNVSDVDLNLHDLIINGIELLTFELDEEDGFDISTREHYADNIQNAITYLTYLLLGDNSRVFIGAIGKALIPHLLIYMFNNKYDIPLADIVKSVLDENAITYDETKIIESCASVKQLFALYFKRIIKQDSHDMVILGSFMYNIELIAMIHSPECTYSLLVNLPQ